MAVHLLSGDQVFCDAILDLLRSMPLLCSAEFILRSCLWDYRLGDSFLKSYLVLEHSVEL